MELKPSLFWGNFFLKSMHRFFFIIHIFQKHFEDLLYFQGVHIKRVISDFGLLTCWGEIRAGCLSGEQLGLVRVFGYTGRPGGSHEALGAELLQNSDMNGLMEITLHFYIITCTSFHHSVHLDSYKLVDFLLQIFFQLSECLTADMIFDQVC